MTEGRSTIEPPSPQSDGGTAEGGKKTSHMCSQASEKGNYGQNESCWKPLGKPSMTNLSKAIKGQPQTALTSGDLVRFFRPLVGDRTTGYPPYLP